MELTRLLQKQVSTHLSEEHLSDPAIRELLSTINDSYLSLERDKELLNQAFDASKQEYQQVYKNLNQAYELKKVSIEKLKKAVQQIDEKNEITFPGDEDDLLGIVNYLNTEIIRRKEAQQHLSRTFNLLTTLFSKINSGILVEDENRKILFTNQLFCDTFSITASPDQLVGLDCSDSAEQTQHLFKNSENFIQRIEQILKNKVPVFADELEMMDGRMLQRDYVPVFVGNSYKGHLWDYTDITERKAYETRLIDLTNLQNAILNGTDYSIIYTDRDGIIRSFNRGAENMLGYTADELVGKSSPEVFHDQKEVEAMAQKLTREMGCEVKAGFDVFIIKSRNSATDTNEWTYIKKSKERLKVQLSISAIRNASNEIMGYLGIARDITEQKKALEALEASEERYRNIVEKSTDVIYKSDKKGCFTYVNPVAERVTGYKKEELIGKHFSELIREEQRHEAIEFYRDQLQNKKNTTYYEFPLVTKKGEVVWIGQSVQLSEIRKNEIEFTALAINITERKNYERGIALQNEKYRNIITNMNLGLLEVDLNERVQFVNQGFTLLSGFDSSEVLGKKASDLFVLGSHAELIKQKNELRSKGISDLYEIAVVNKKGEQRWWMVSGAPNYNDQGQLIGSIGIHLDITEKKELELALESAKFRAEESSKAKAVFLANMSHEIRTPLNGIIGMIRELTYENLSEKQMKYVSNASIASQHLLSVLNNILDISKIEAGELSLEKHHFRLRDTVKDVKSIMTARAREKGLLLNLDVHEIKNVTYIGDSSRIRQMLLNLIGNAIKFTHSGGIFVECKIKESLHHSHAVSISVEDTGIGMDDAYLDKVFKKFSQEDSSTSRKFGGTGLGMAITREIIQLMGGTIQVKSKKNEGTLVELLFELPLGDNTMITDDNNNMILRDLSHVRILLVEDNDFNRAAAWNTLNRFKCKITEAVNGKDALALLSKHTYDLILMDLQMPVMNGFEATEAIRNKLGLNLPVIALTANAFKSELEQCIRIGMTDYVTKPFEEEKLMSVIMKALHLSPDPLKNVVFKDYTLPPGKLYTLQKLADLTTNDTTYLKKMLGIFMEQTECTIHEIESAYNRKNMKSLYEAAHKIKPSLDSMGVEVLHDVIREVEKSAKEQKDSDALTLKIKFVLTTLRELLEQLKLEK